MNLTEGSLFAVAEGWELGAALYPEYVVAMNTSNCSQGKHRDLCTTDYLHNTLC